LVIRHSAVKPGSTQNLAIGGPPNTTATVTIRYASGKAKTARIKLDHGGHGSYSFQVTAGVNSYSSQTASVTLVTTSGRFSGTFTVERATLEVYVDHGQLKPKQSEPIRVIGPRRASIRLQVLFPDGTYLARSVTLDRSGRFVYVLRVPTLRGHPRSTRASVDAIISTPAGDYLASTHFEIK
jgi:hypothetical protein